MYLDKPEWLQGDTDAATPVMAIDVHPQGGRLVSCGPGITVWNLRPILDPAAAAASGAQQVPRQLAHLGDHQQAVNVVRFSHDGAYFASGSDDSCIFVYELRPGKGASSFGSGGSRPNLENWRIRSMLRSHSSNVADLDWAPGDQYLASASFDNKVLVWDLTQKHPHPVVTLEHNGMAKGVAWDPLGKYLASMGDDGLRLWDARTWRQVRFVEEPFRNSSKQNYHLRPAWTVDGSVLIVPNANDSRTNHPTALLLCRDTWEIAKQSFVGHEAPVWAARGSPKMFHTPANMVQARQQGAAQQQGDDDMRDATASLMAVCSADKGCSVWSGVLQRPVVAVQGMFRRGVTDAAWTPDGANLLLASLDGSIAVCRFTAEELGRQVSDEEFAAMLKEDYGDLSADVKPLTEFADIPRPRQQQQQQQAAGPRRIAPLPAGEAQGSPPVTPPAAARGGGGRLGMGAAAGLPPGASALDSRVMPQGAAATTTLAVPKKRSVPAASGAATAAATPTKRQAVGAAGRPVRAQASASQDQAPGSSSRSKGPSQLLPEPAVLPRMQVSIGRAGREVMLPEGQLSMQIQNVASGPVGPSAQVQLWLDKSLMWEDVVEGQVVAAAGSPMYSAVALQGGRLLLYTQRGRRMLGALALGSTAALLCSQGLWHLLVVSTTGTLKVFNLQTIQRDSELSLAPILTPGVTVVDMWLGGTAASQAATHCMPLVILSNGTGWGWHHQLKEWVQMADTRRQLTPHSDPMKLRPGDMSRLLDGILPARGDLLLEPLHDQQLLACRTRAGFEEWLATATMLGAAESARVALGAYVRQLVLADDLSRLIEVIQELLGPVRRQPGHPWEATLCGMSKWELLREEVLPLMAGKPKLESNRRLVQQQLEEAELWQKQLLQTSEPGEKTSLSWLPRLQGGPHGASDAS